MSFKVELCSQIEWAENSSKMMSVSLPLENYIAANILSCSQFLPEEKHLMQSQAFCLVNDAQQSVAWLNAYFISEKVLRIRGIYVLPHYRRQGCMSLLVNEVIKKYSTKVQKVISFSRKSSIAFYEKNNFRLEKRFIPRTLVLYNADARSYFHDPDGEIYLMFKNT